MLPYLAASGHNLYVKSAHVYLQDMLELEQTHPNLDAAFKSGLHVVKRCDRFWCGLSTDLVIEQALMRSIKSIGGFNARQRLNRNSKSSVVTEHATLCGNESSYAKTNRCKLSNQ